MTEDEARTAYERMTDRERMWFLHAADLLLFDLNVKAHAKRPSQAVREMASFPIVTEMMNLLRPGWGSRTAEQRGDYYAAEREAAAAADAK